jgi:hypothetical protein
MNYVLISVEFEPNDNERERRERLANVLPTMGSTCHALTSMWIISTAITSAEVYRRLTDPHAAEGQAPISQRDRLIVAPIHTPSEGEEPWHAMNAPSATKCFNMP